MARYTLAEPDDVCPCCGSGSVEAIHGRDGNVCPSCADRGMHLCGATTRKGTPCKHWTADERCPQHTTAEAAA